MLDVYGGEYEFISIHAPAGGATGWGEEILPINEISIHAPAGGATCRQGTAAGARSFQFTPLREGRHLDLPSFGIKKTISIHAPAGGATTGNLYSSSQCQFQFTPLREGRHERLRQCA